MPPTPLDIDRLRRLTYDGGVAWRDGSRVSVVFPTYNERESIRAAILDFVTTGVADEIVVVNNNAAEGTSQEVALAVAEALRGEIREIFEPRQGYGSAIQRGLRESTGTTSLSPSRTAHSLVGTWSSCSPMSTTSTSFTVAAQRAHSSGAGRTWAPFCDRWKRFRA